MLFVPLQVLLAAPFPRLGQAMVQFVDELLQVPSTRYWVVADSPWGLMGFAGLMECSTCPYLGQPLEDAIQGVEARPK